MKKNFVIVVESFHIPDSGYQENVSSTKIHNSNGIFFFFLLLHAAFSTSSSVMDSQ